MYIYTYYNDTTNNNSNNNMSQYNPNNELVMNI